MPLRIIFCGTPEFAVPSLVALASEPEFKVEGVVTQPDRPSGRGQSLAKSPVKIAAEQRSIPVFQPTKLKSPEVLAYFENPKPDAVVIIAYGRIIPAQLLAIPRLGWIDVHGSLLPKVPQRHSDPLGHRQRRKNHRPHHDESGPRPRHRPHAPKLRNQNRRRRNFARTLCAPRLASAAAPLIIESLEGLAAGKITPTPQDNTQATLAPLLKKEDGRIDWTRDGSAAIYNRMRAFQPWPGAFTTFRGNQCSIWGKPVVCESSGSPPGTITARLGDIFIDCGKLTTLRLEQVQREGRKRITAREFANGERLAAGESFGS